MKNFKKLVLIGLLVIFSASAFAKLVHIACENGTIINYFTAERDGTQEQLQEIREAAAALCK